MGLGGHDNALAGGEYVCTLPEDVKKVALEELREDDNIRDQSLEQMRDWIAKHPCIKKCRTDPAFLLRFLRTKKFSVPQACEMLERFLTMRQLLPAWFGSLDCEDKDLADIVEAGYLVPLLERDNGRLVLLSVAGSFDPHKFTAAHMARTHSMIIETFIDDEVNQVNGYTYLNDESGFTMAHLSLWSLTDMRNMLRCIQNSTPVRHKRNIFVNIPEYAKKMLDIGMSILNEKLRNRMFFCKDLEELHQKIDPKILPKEYGGTVPMSEMIDKLKVKLKERRAALLTLDEMSIEINEKENKFISEIAEDLDFGLDGSFKKLQFD